MRLKDRLLPRQRHRDDGRTRPRGSRTRLRRRRTLVISLLLAAAVLVGVDLARGSRPRPSVPTTASSPSSPSGPSAAAPAPAAARTESPLAEPAAAPAHVPIFGRGIFDYADSQRPVLGAAGTIQRFKVAVERGTGQDPAEFAADADAVLGDPRSWVAGGQLRLQRVAAQANADFTIYLATADTSTKMCAVGGLDTNGYTSCRLPGQVIINLSRWLTAVPDYGAPLDVYRAYALNHEVGHQLGRGHEACPGPGQPAPVMQQQTLGLRGCVANGWPYVSGQRYTGAAVP